MNIAKSIFELMLGVMKKQLNLAEFRFGGKNSDSYKFFKEQTMNSFYDDTKKLFSQMVVEGILEKCPCLANLRHGWKFCECGGSGYCDKKNSEVV
jgi:hypothetical protein